MYSVLWSTLSTWNIHNPVNSQTLVDMLSHESPRCNLSPNLLSKTVFQLLLTGQSIVRLNLILSMAKSKGLTVKWPCVMTIPRDDPRPPSMNCYLQLAFMFPQVVVWTDYEHIQSLVNFWSRVSDSTFYTCLRRSIVPQLLRMISTEDPRSVTIYTLLTKLMRI